MRFCDEVLPMSWKVLTQVDGVMVLSQMGVGGEDGLAEGALACC